jgi:hypothetical protein
MNVNQDTPGVNRASGAAVGFIIASMIFIALVIVVKFSVHAPAIDADRATVISQALFEIHTNEAALLNNATWADQPRGIVRLPVETAMKITASEWQNPAQARADLISREEKVNAPVSVKPAAPNPFD